MRMGWWTKIEGGLKFFFIYLYETLTDLDAVALNWCFFVFVFVLHSCIWGLVLLEWFHALSVKLSWHGKILIHIEPNSAHGEWYSVISARSNIRIARWSYMNQPVRLDSLTLKANKIFIRQEPEINFFFFGKYLWLTQFSKDWDTEWNKKILNGYVYYQLIKMLLLASLIHKKLGIKIR